MTLAPASPSQAAFPQAANRFAGMPREQAVGAFLRMLDAWEAGAQPWAEQEMVDRFIAACSPTGSEATVSGYLREITGFRDWLQRHHPQLTLQTVDPVVCQNWLDHLLAEVHAGQLAARTYNRRVSAISSMYRWCSEPARSAVSGVLRNPIPRRSLLKTTKTTRALGDTDFDRVLGVIAAAAEGTGREAATARRDYVLVRCTFLTGARVSEIAKLRWADVEQLEDGCGLIHLFGKGSKARSVRVSAATLTLFESLGRRGPTDWVFPSNRGNGHLSRQAIADRMNRWGKKVEVHLHPHKLRHTHATRAVQRGVNIFVLMNTLGHASTATTQAYISLSPNESSSLQLG